MKPSHHKIPVNFILKLCIWVKSHQRRLSGPAPKSCHGNFVAMTKQIATANFNYLEKIYNHEIVKNRLCAFSVNTSNAKPAVC